MTAAALLLTLGVVTQCPIYVETVSVVSLPPPSVIVAPVIREKVYFYDVERTRIYVEAALPTGSHITVPVINGYTPRVTISHGTDGSTLREYFYDEQIAYRGGVINYQSQNQIRSLPPMPKKIAMPSPHAAAPDCKENIERLEKMIRELQQGRVQAGIPTRTQTQEAPAPDMQYMKRPSEFD